MGAHTNDDRVKMLDALAAGALVSLAHPAQAGQFIKSLA